MLKCVCMFTLVCAQVELTALMVVKRLRLLNDFSRGMAALKEPSFKERFLLLQQAMPDSAPPARCV